MATLSIQNITKNSCEWVVSGLSTYWDDNNYQRAVMCTGFDGFQPTGILDTRYPPTSGTTYGFTEHCSSLTPDTSYYVYAFGLAANGSWYQIGSGQSFTTLTDAPQQPTSIYTSMSGLNGTTYWNKGANTVSTDVDYDFMGSSPDFNTTSTAYSFTVSQYNTMYAVRMRGKHSDGRVSAWTGWMYFQSGQPPTPETPTGLTGNAVSKNQINLDCNAVAYADSYKWYRNGVHAYTSSISEVSATGLSEYTDYTFRVSAVRAGVEGSLSSSITIKTLDQTVPTVSITAETVLNTRISISFTSSDAHSGKNYHEVFISKKNQTLLYYKAQLSSAASTYNFEYDADGLPLESGATYTVGVRVYDMQGNYSTMASITRTTPTSRPPDWAWFTPKTSGAGVSTNLSYDEWNKFCSRINDFRVYKGLSSYGFTNATQGGTFFWYMFNQAKDAIQDLPRTVNVPTSVNSGQDLYASMLNQLRDALNSTTA